MRLYVIRHGETLWNKLKRFQGQTDIELAENGILMAQKTGEGMKNIPIDLIISSPLKRAVQTAKLVRGDRDIPLITDDRIKEICFGDWEGLSSGENSLIPADYLENFYTTPLKCQTPPNGESFLDVCNRTELFLHEIINRKDYEDKTILISSHGAASRCLLHALNKESDDIWRGCIPPNCSVSQIDVIDHIPQLVALDVIY